MNADVNMNNNITTDLSTGIGPKGEEEWTATYKSAGIVCCPNCDTPVRAPEYLRRCDCGNCGNRIYIRKNSPPAVVLKSTVDARMAQKIYLKSLETPEFADHFAKDATFEEAIRYYIPYWEFNGIKKEHLSREPSEPPVPTLTATHYLTPANDLKRLSLRYFQQEDVENAIMHGEQDTLDLIAMRKKGIILPPDPVVTVKSQLDAHSLESVDHINRLLFFPIWELRYRRHGMLFKSYISAVDGVPLKIHGLRNQKKNLLYSMAGLLCLAILLGRGIHAGGSGMWASFLIWIPAFLALFPYFWELFAFQDTVEKRGEAVEYFPIHYTPNSFLKFCRKLVFWRAPKKPQE